MVRSSRDGLTSSGKGPAPGRTEGLLLLATVFASGAAVMIVEMTAVRSVQPFFGSTTYVWTNVIAVVLSALAVGYAAGGVLADRWPRPGLLFGLLGAGGLLVATSAFLVTPVSRLFLDEGVDLEGVVSVLTWGSLGTALILFAPPILLLGAVSPIAIRLLARRGVGRAAGSVIACSTVGSILGTYLPTLVLVPRLGSRGAILVAAAILLGASGIGLLAFGGARRRAAVLLLLTATSAGAAVSRLPAPGRPPPRIAGGASTLLEEVESPYQYLTVRDDVWPDGSERVLTINEGLHTFHALRVPGRVLTGSRFYDAYSVLPLLLDLEPGAAFRGCVVGLACGVNASQWRHLYAGLYDVRVDGAEIDPEIVRLGRQYFDLPGEDQTWLRVYVLDGRSLLERVREGTRYHAIVVDAFANELYVPYHLATREFFELCRTRLEEGGILAMNVHARDVGAANLAAIRATMATVFPAVLCVPHYETGGFFLLARRGEEPLDPARLGEAEVRRRFATWDGFERWSATPEWNDLLDLAEALRARAGTVATASPPDGMVLTDDHAPLEWLTDRFLLDAEAALLEAGAPRGAALVRLRERQAGLLLVVGAVWGLTIVAGVVALRAARMRAPAA